MRYKLEKIDQVVNGTVQGNTVQFDLSGNQNGTASFTNKKSGDGLLTDTDYVRNIVILKNEKCSIAVPARLQRQVLQQRILIILYF